mmetsp:Transcript_24796/g.34084  ORF Transcript_24796/g.34084 Transcript_24796/m.34084 type:complete len:86 (+) Transcript_24796:444-701(+)
MPAICVDGSSGGGMQHLTQQTMNHYSINSDCIPQWNPNLVANPELSAYGNDQIINASLILQIIESQHIIMLCWLGTYENGPIFNS